MGEQLFDVAIVGYGPVGAAAANLCGQAGLRTVVLERGVEPYDLPRAIHFDAEVMRIFQSLGLADRIETLTRPLGGSVYLGVDAAPIRVFRGRDVRPLLGWAGSNLFYQPELEGVLREGAARFASVDVRLGHDVREVSVEAGHGVVRYRSVEGEGEVRARYVLACDGASSPVRKGLGVTLDDMRFEERWLVIDAFVNGPMRWPDDMEIPQEVRDGRYSLMVCDPARPATLIPGRGTHRRWEYMLLADETDDAMQQPETIAGLLSQWVDPEDAQVVRSAVYRFHGLVAHRWREGPVFLLGDAAHQTPPFYGQGMCHGMRDAAQLIWKLKMVLDGVADDALLDTYQAEREEHVEAIISASVAAGAAVCILDPARARQRDADFRAQEASRGESVAFTDVVPPIRSGVIAHGGGAGQRLPQPPVTVAGEARRLDDVLGGRFSLLTFEPEASDRAVVAADAGWSRLGGDTLRLTAAEGPSEAYCVRDVDGVLAGWLQTHGARWVLVRPDRYVFGSAATPDDLRRLLHDLTQSLRMTDGAAAPLEAHA